MQNWDFNIHDKEIKMQLSEFLPRKIFDIHAHIYRVPDLNLAVPCIWSEGPSEISVAVWRENMSRFTEGKELCGGLFLPAPAPGSDIKKENEYIISQVAECVKL